jgi:hypothetical protein
MFPPRALLVVATLGLSLARSSAAHAQASEFGYELGAGLEVGAPSKGSLVLSLLLGKASAQAQWSAFVA